MFERIRTIVISLLLVCVLSCGSSDFKKSPLDTYIVENTNEKKFSVILEDMKQEGTFFKSYFHKYKIIKHKEDDTPYAESTDWIEVDERFFGMHRDNLGMVILDKQDIGKISKAASPPGYQYVGDPKYGEWKTHNGSTFWSFYGKYMFMNQLFGMFSRPIYRNDYDTYRGGGYYGKRSYYGPKTSNGTPRYGTNSAQTRKEKPNFFRRRAAKSGWSSSTSRSRYSGGRSRSRGFGK